MSLTSAEAREVLQFILLLQTKKQNKTNLQTLSSCQTGPVDSSLIQWALKLARWVLFYFNFTDFLAFPPCPRDPLGTFLTFTQTKYNHYQPVKVFPCRSTWLEILNYLANYDKQLCTCYQIFTKHENIHSVVTFVCFSLWTTQAYRLTGSKSPSIAITNTLSCTYDLQCARDDKVCAKDGMKWDNKNSLFQQTVVVTPLKWAVFLSQFTSG